MPSNKLLVLVFALVLGGCASVAPGPDVTAEAAATDGVYAIKAAAPARVKKAAPEFERALAALRNGEANTAKPLLLKLTQDFPDLAGPWLNLGILLAGQNELEAAESALGKAIAINTANAVAQHELAIVLRRQGKFAEALSAYSKTLELQPDYALAHRNLGILYDLYLGEPKQALRHYQHFQNLNDSHDKHVAVWISELEQRLHMNKHLTAENGQ